MGRNGVSAAPKRLAIPRRVALGELESGCFTVGVVGLERIAALQLKAGNQYAHRRHVPSATGDERALGTGRREERNVASHDHEVEGAPEIEGGEVVLDP